MTAIPVSVFLVGISVASLALLLVVLLEIARGNALRERGKMFASDKFDEKVAHLNLTETERNYLERLSRESSFSNKDAVLNSPLLFEQAVNDAYAFYGGAEKVPPADREAISALRRRLGHLENADKFSYVSSRQFSPGKNVTFFVPGKDASPLAVHSQIDFVDEVEWGVHVDSPESVRPLLGERLLVRLNIPGEAVYSATLRVVGLRGNSLCFEHTVNLHKEQLRRWVRMAVRLPVHLDFNGHGQDGSLVDLSAGGILLSLREMVPEGSTVQIRFELPGFGEENLQVRILRQLHGGRFDEMTGGYDHSASFMGDFGEVQEHVLQYIFRERKAQKRT